MKLSAHEKTARIVFWFAQVAGVTTIVAILIFIWGNLIDELLHQYIDFKEDYSLFIFAFSETLIAVSFVISWYKKRLGAILVILFTVLSLALWGEVDMNIILLHLPVFLTGLLLLFYYYYKEWILKQKA